MSKLFLETLDLNRKTVFAKLKSFSQLGVLGGGTAIALQLNHRRSFDFDIFLNEPIRPTLLPMAHRALGPGASQTLNEPNQINLLTREGVAVTFFYDEAKIIFPPLSDPVIDLMDLRDVASNKAVTIGFRGKWRDYVDVFFLLRERKTTLPEIISISEKRRGSGFSARLFLQQLVYFDDIIDYSIDYVNEAPPPEKIKEFLVDQVDKLS